MQTMWFRRDEKEVHFFAMALNVILKPRASLWPSKFEFWSSKTGFWHQSENLKQKKLLAGLGFCKRKSGKRKEREANQSMPCQEGFVVKGVWLAGLHTCTHTYTRVRRNNTWSLQGLATLQTTAVAESAASASAVTLKLLPKNLGRFVQPRDP